ncbi:DnaJ domain-containing protein [Marinobacter sp. TBZ242]|uniref:DnaJ domain-containing protein n=1 Tax=Marinobacter azerbaijanicus TaxID=3050455 RepID=A0ABT7IAK0_9GAMM|nr:DnaJ domain-containing protein [Marinobacter sp. TBZ242]MDL0431135.1 DnaJ domain-containing protein [Marinobacter sp. TBZ242]
MQWILGIALAAAVFIILKQWGALTPEKKKAATWKILLVTGAALLLFMVLTGRVHVLTAAVAALLPLLRKVPALLRFAPMVRRVFGQPLNHEAHDSGSGESRHQPADSSGNMSVKEACEILGVEPDCAEEVIIQAHRRLIQKLHPDRGGNDYLAAKINEAKSVLLKSRA